MVPVTAPACGLPVYADLLGICDGSPENARDIKGVLAFFKAYPALPSPR